MSHDGHYTSPPVETKLGGLFIVGQIAAAIPDLPLKLCFPWLTTIHALNSNESTSIH